MTRTKKVVLVTAAMALSAVIGAVVAGNRAPALPGNSAPAVLADSHTPVSPYDSHTPVGPQGDSHTP